MSRKTHDRRAEMIKITETTAAPEIVADSDLIYALDDGRLGVVGAINTHLGLNGWFIWYAPKEVPKLNELRQMRRMLDAWQEEFRATFWMTTIEKDLRLQRWAKFMGFVSNGPFAAKPGHEQWVKIYGH